MDHGGLGFAEASAREIGDEASDSGTQDGGSERAEHHGADATLRARVTALRRTLDGDAIGDREADAEGPSRR